jgi:diacylglycerol kinase (ATP)
MPRRCLAVVLNPRGGKRRGVPVLKRISPFFAKAGIELNVHMTERPGHAHEIARSLDQNSVQGICVVGGDGTFHEVVDGLMHRNEPISIPLGIIPAGTGNSLAQHLNCKDPMQAALQIVAGRTMPLDVVRVSMGDKTAYCSNIVGWGAVSDINIMAEKLRILGKSRYAAAALLEILRAKRRRAKILLDGRMLQDSFLFFIACNGKFTGADMKLTPGAEIGDGMIDVALVRNASRWQMLKLFTKVFDGSHVSLDFIEFYQVRSFEIQTETPDRMNLDGEMRGTSPVAGEVMPAALSIFY